MKVVIKIRKHHVRRDLMAAVKKAKTKRVIRVLIKKAHDFAEKEIKAAAK